MQRDALDAFGISLAICNPLTGGQVAVSESMGAAICAAVNDWIIEHWLDRDAACAPPSWCRRRRR